MTVSMKDLENGNGRTEKAKVGTADFLIELENKRAIKVGWCLFQLWLSMNFKILIRLCFPSPSASIFFEAIQTSLLPRV